MNSHTREVVNGTYESEIGSTTIKVICNDNSGFSIYATGFTGETIADTNSNKLVGTVASGTATIDTGTATSAGDPDVSNWAVKLTATSGANVNYPLTISTGYDAYHEVPNTWTKVATRTAGTDVGTNAEGSTMTTTYAAYISKTQPADTYTGKVKYTLVHPNDAPAPKVLPPAPTSCNTPVPNITYMQDITSSNKSTVLASLTEDAPYYLRDSRDEEPYCVSKLKDGNLWLLDNLRLDLSDADTLAAVAETNTNASATTLGYLKNGGGSTDSSSPLYKYAKTGIVEWTDSPTYASGRSYSDPLIATSGSGWSKDTTTTSYGNGSGKIGVYYNFCAASAGSYCYGNGTDYGTSTGNATEDLCPSGWRMPSGGSAGEYGVLNSNYYTNTTASNIGSYQYALSTPLSGRFYDGSAYNQGSYGNFWPSTRLNSNNMYSLYVSSSVVVPASYYDRYNGLSMRCLLQ
ncbi:hypothetical protein IKF92_02970 [Candidatus Saccharibacteria bacterium]|nr:hypothetical protein [Candidatus Saccharibacteria bacterium]